MPAMTVKGVIDMAKKTRSGENVDVVRYTPTEWATGDLITAEKLNNIETGIGANETAISGIDTRVTAIENENFDVTFTGSDLETVVCNRTLAEIIAAHEAGKNIRTYWITDALQTDGYYTKYECNYKLFIRPSSPTDDVFNGYVVMNGYTVVVLGRNSEGATIRMFELALATT